MGYLNSDTYKCDICGKPKDACNGVIFITRALDFAICDDCYDSMHTEKICPNCESDLFIGTEFDYDYVCYECGDDFYEFEIDKQGD